MAKRPQLWPWQDALKARHNQELLAGNRSQVIQSPTGSGKTVVVAAIIKEAVQRGERVLFIDHRRELTTQCSGKLYDLGIHHGIIQAGLLPRPSAPVQVASIQTIHARCFRSRRLELPPADLVIFDECHHCRAPTYEQIADAYPTAVKLGLSATPIRGDGRGLGNRFGILIQGPPIIDLIALGHLVGTRVYAPSRPDLSGLRIKMGDYVESELAQRVNTPKLVGDIVEHWFKLAERRPTVIFATGVAHSVHIRDQFCRAGVLAEHIDASTPKPDRDAALARLAAGKTDIVTNTMVLTEGWDCPAVSCIVLARPTRSLGLYFQIVGRGLRPSPGKPDALVLDHAGAVFQHGFVEDPIEWTLNEDRRAVNAAHQSRLAEPHSQGLTTCPECHKVRVEGQPCGSCGWRPVAKPKSFDVLDGELGEVDRHHRHVHVSDWTTEKKLVFYRQLMGVAQQRGHKRGSAAHRFKDRFGEFPPRAWNSAQPLPPSPAVLAWWRSRDIAYAKAMRKAGAGR